MSKRINVLSKEIGLTNSQVLEICTQLAISSKTHSSNISQEEENRIREVAKNYQMTSSKTKGKSNSSSPKKPQPPTLKSDKPNKPKLEIVAIHKKNREQDNSVTGAETTPTPALKAPPRPNAPLSNGKEPKIEPSPSVAEISPVENLKSPPPRPQSNGIETKLEQTPPQELTPPVELKAPPAPPKTSRKEIESEAPQKPRSVAKLMDSIDSDRKPKPRVKSKPSIFYGSKPTIEDREEEPRKVAKPVALKEEAKTSTIKAPPRPKLQRPPQRPPEVVDEADIDDDLENKSTDNDDDFDGEVTLLEKPKRAKQKVKKTGVESTWDEEEDTDKENKKAGKKRKSYILEDDDDLIDLLDDDGEGDAMLNLALARPDKPANTTVKAPEKTKSPRRQKPKIDRGESNAKVAEQKKIKQEKEKPEQIILKQSLTLRELADLVCVSDTEIIRMLFFKGIAVNITETLDLDIAKMVAEELEIEVITQVDKANASKTEMLEEKDFDYLSHRPPVVTIMGHVDHGKTTLLDSIRNTKVVLGEAGGITQHIGAYHVDVEHEGKTQQIVFLDTPGHEAFTAMRARGAKVTDIAILVVAADDGVRPQTREAISHAKAAKVPIVVAINKIDKAGANPDRVKQELSELELVPEDWGGDTVMVPVSALNGENLDTLLEMIVLVSEMEELLANPDRMAKGTVIEAHLDRARGPVATLLVQNGTLRVGDVIVAGSVAGKIRAMIDDRGAKVDAATPSFAVEVLGLNEVPQAGDEFDVYANEKEARLLAESRAEDQRTTRLQQALSSRRVSLSTLSAQAQQGELKELNIILKGDVQGSVEAILGSLKQLPQREVQIRVLLASAGEVTETDVDLAAASGAVVIGFNTTLAPNARQAAEQEGVDIREYNVIYKLLDEIQGAMEGLLDPEEVEESLGRAEVRAVFPVGKGAVAGCYVLSGKVVRNRFIRVLRKGEEVYNGNLDSLRRVKDDVKEVASGFECGISINKFGNWQEGDIIEAYEMAFKRRTLSQ
ncbi:MAG: translation initiation factor IF-2 [Cyanobacterium sp. T60_A2020_053]|nr:translation initiation factor IF-2 [Cyanobacterium sp. T60_A2020_053]